MSQTLKPTRRDFILAAAALIIEGVALPASATAGKHHSSVVHPAAKPAHAESALLFDADRGNVLFAENLDKPLPPASLTKLMTIYLAFQALKQGAAGQPRGWQLTTALPVSRHAAQQDYAKLNLKPGLSKLMVKDAILAMIGPSANDAAVVVAEGLGKTEKKFAEMMNTTAATLGMTATHFANASGLPDPQQKSTARDMAILMQALRTDFPAYYGLFKDPVFFDPNGWKINGQVLYSHNSILHGVDPNPHAKNHNPGANVYPGAEAGKTGYIGSIGCNMVAAIDRDGHHVIGVLFGMPSAVVRDARMRNMLNVAFPPVPEPVKPALPEMAKPGPTQVAAIAPT